MKSWILAAGLLSLCSWLGWTSYEQAVKPMPPIGTRAGNAVALPVREKGISRQEKKKANAFPALDTLDDIVSRPLFNVSRRPIEADKITSDAEPSELHIMLSGIVIGHTGQIAHLRSATDKQTKALRVGDKIDGWQIESIFPDRVVLKSGGRVETVFMQKPGESRPPPRVKPPARRAGGTRNRNTRRNFRRPQPRGGR
jgi:type II secretory pathway component PulC